MKIQDYFLTHEHFELQETEILGVYKTVPVPQDLGKYYQSKKYISHHQDSGSLKEKLYKFVQSFNLNYKRNLLSKEVFENAQVLDYGCGAGEFLKHIEEDVVPFGFEPNDDARNFAKGKTKKTTFISSLEEIEDGSLDAITLWHVFEHVENPQQLLQEFDRKLKPNGCLILAVPNCSSFDALYYKNFWAAYDVPRHLFHYTQKGMIQFLEQNGWKTHKIKPLIFDAFYIAMLSEKYRKNPFSLISGTIVGAISNIKASKNNDFSSLVYVVRKKEK